MKITIVCCLSLFLLLFLFTCQGNAQEPMVETLKEAVPEAMPATEAVASPRFLFLADIHLNHQATGTAKSDDTGTALWDATKQRLKTMMASASAPEFIIYTGDLTAHDYQPGQSPGHHHLSQSQLDTNMAIVLNDLYDIAGNVPLFYAPGNNDALDGDYSNFANSAGNTPFSLIDNARINYPAPNATMVSQPHPKRGYYSARPFAGLRVIALNSVILGKEHWSQRFKHNFVAYGDEMMQWLTQELADVKAKGEKAFLIMHIPPGTDAYSRSYNKNMWTSNDSVHWQTNLLQLAVLHQNEISGIFYGHTHMDEIRLLTSPGNNKTITEVAISGPGISPNHGQNPAFKTVSYDASSFEPTDFTTYYTSQYNPSWKPTDKYTFSGKYGMSRISNLTGPLSSQKLGIIQTGLLKTYKAGKGTASSKAANGLLVN